MEEVIRKNVDKNGNKSVTYRKEWEKNGLRMSKEVRQVEGGYIVRESKSGRPADDENAEYVDENKEYVTVDNPFEEKKKETKDANFFDFVDKPSF